MHTSLQEVNQATETQLIINEFVSGVIAVIIAYLLGSIPAAYIVTRLTTGKDLRQLGGGNVGARSVYREVGLIPAILAGVFDVGKGVAAVFIAWELLGITQVWLLAAPQFFLLAAGLAVVAGHIWSVYLQFTGGNGLSPTIGVLSVLMTQELLLALAITVVLIFFTRNPVLSVNISLLLVPVLAWFTQQYWLPVVFGVALALILVLHFIPTARDALAQAGSKENLFAELVWGKKAKKGKG